MHHKNELSLTNSVSRLNQLESTVELTSLGLTQIAVHVLL